MRLLPVMMCISLALFQLPAIGDNTLYSTDAVLIAKYKQLQAEMKLGEELNSHQQLMKTSKHLLMLTDEGLSASKKLEEYAYAVRYTGLFFETPLQEVKKFQKSLKRLANHPALQGFESYMQVQKDWDNFVNITSGLSKTKNNPDLPPSAKSSLGALQSLGLGLQQLGKTPVLGAALEGYGDMIGELAKTLNNLAGNATATSKAGIFSKVEEQELLGNLNKSNQYAKTPLWKYGIPVIHEWPYSIGKEKYYIQHSNGFWKPVEYSDIAEIAVSYQLVYNKPIDNTTVWKYINNKDLKESLISRSETELEFKRVEEILGDVPGVNRKLRFSQFSSIENKIIKWHKQLQLPLSYKQLSRHIRLEYQNPGVIGRSLKRRVINAYPEFKRYLKFLELENNKISMTDILTHFSNYKKGKHLVATLELHIVDAETNSQLNNATIEIQGPVHKTVKLKNGKVIIPELPPGKYRITIRSKGYYERSNGLRLTPMTHIAKKAVLGKVAQKPKKKKIKTMVKTKPKNKPTRISSPPVNASNSDCYTSKYASKVSIARRANEASSPAGSIGLLYASPECEAKFKNCQNHSIKLGAECRQSSTGYDFKAINNKCNALVNKRVRQCAQQEVSCSEGVYRSNCNEKQIKHPKKVTNNCYTPYAEKVKRALQSNASNNPSGNMGIVLLNGSAECTAAHKKCSDAALKGGVKCRNMDHGVIDPVAVTKKCNIVVNTGWIKCAQQEVKCSASAFKRKCGQ